MGRLSHGIVTTDNKVAYPLFNLRIALTAGFLEEIGWTGFAVPALRQRYGMFTTGLIVGISLLIAEFVLAAAWWVVVAAVAVANREHLSRQPLYKEMGVAGS